MKKGNLRLYIVVVFAFVFFFLGINTQKDLTPLECPEVGSGSCENTVIVTKLDGTIIGVKQINQKSFNRSNFDTDIAPGYEVFYRIFSTNSGKPETEIQIRKNIPYDEKVGFYTCKDSDCPKIDAMDKYVGSLPKISYALYDSSNNQIIKNSTKTTDGKSTGINKDWHAEEVSLFKKLKRTFLSFTQSIYHKIANKFGINVGTKPTDNVTLKILDNGVPKDFIVKSEGVWKVKGKWQDLNNPLRVSYEPSYKPNGKSYDISSESINFAPKILFVFFGIAPFIVMLSILYKFSSKYSLLSYYEDEQSTINFYLFTGLSVLFLIRLYFALAVTSLYVSRFSNVFLALLALWIIPITITITIFSLTSEKRNEIYSYFYDIKLRTIILIFSTSIMALIISLWFFLGYQSHPSVSAMIFVQMPFEELLTNFSFATIRDNATFYLEFLVIVFMPLLLYLCSRFNLSRNFCILALIIMMVALSLISDSKNQFLDKIPYAMILCLILPVLILEVLEKSNSLLQKGIYFVAIVSLPIVAFLFDKGSVLHLVAFVVATFIVMKKYHNYFIYRILVSLITLAFIAIIGLKVYSVINLKNNDNMGSVSAINPLNLDICQIPKDIAPITFKLGKVDQSIFDSTDITNDEKCKEIQKRPIETIADLDNCVRFCGLSNSDARIYSWLNANPYDIVLTNAPFGRLQELSRVRSYSIPKSIWWGDGGFYPYEYTEKKKLDGAMFEHLGGLVYVKPFGLLGILLLLGCYVLIIISIHKTNYAAKIFVTTIGLVSFYILFQSMNVFPLIGHNLPLMVISSFTKDFLPICVGLVIFLCLEKENKI